METNLGYIEQEARALIPPDAILIDPTAPETVAALAAALDVEWAWRELPPEEADGEVHVVAWDKAAMAAAILPAFVARLRGET